MRQTSRCASLVGHSLENLRAMASQSALLLCKLLDRLARKQITARMLANMPRGFDPDGNRAASRDADTTHGLSTSDLSDLSEFIAWSHQAIRKPARGHLYEQSAETSEIMAISIFDPEYPHLLRQIPDPPLVLFCQGSLAAWRKYTVAVVGARRATRTGIEIAFDLARDLAFANVVTVSGLARGIDGAAHRGALQAGRFPTVAVLGSGLGNVYPSEHRRLAQQICDQDGLIISEFPHAAAPLKHHFPERNRIISGSADAVVLVEAGVHSGSLITARLALEQVRDVLAFPGSPRSETSAGCHRLIQQGAGLVLNADDVLHELSPPGWAQSGTEHGEQAIGMELTAQRSACYQQCGPEAAALLDVMNAEPQSLDELIFISALPPQELSVLVIELELAGFVTRFAEGYIRAS